MKKDFYELVNSETAYGDPQWWMCGLDRDRILEVTHEEYGLSKDEQFYSCRVHCNEDEYVNGDYDETNGIIEMICLDTFDYDKIVEWAERIASEVD